MFLCFVGGVYEVRSLLSWVNGSEKTNFTLWNNAYLQKPNSGSNNWYMTLPDDFVFIDHTKNGLTLQLPDQICNSSYCQPYNSCNVSSENVVLDQLIIPKLIFFFMLITYLADVIWILWGEILSWSLIGVKGLILGGYLIAILASEAGVQMSQSSKVQMPNPGVTWDGMLKLWIDLHIILLLPRITKALSILRPS